MSFYFFRRLILCLSLVSFSSSYAEESGRLKKALKEKAAKSSSSEASATFEKGIESLRERQLVENARAKGEKVPAYTFSNGKTLSSYYQKGPVVLNFYRGHWCPYCLLELKEYERLHPEFKKLGASILSISPDTQVQSRKTRDKQELSYEVLSDKDNALAKKMGLAFKVDDETLEYYSKYGIDLEASQGNSQNNLPMPGTYVLNKSGEIVYAFVDPDYKVRAEPEEVLKVIETLNSL